MKSLSVTVSHEINFGTPNAHHRVRVKILVLAKSGEYESLLHALLLRETRIVTNGPAIADYLVRFDA